MRVLELYSGIGGMHYALRESGVKGDVVAAADINNVANDVYKNNFPNVLLMNRNIQSITAQEINNLNVDTILMSPPCQPYTRVGLQKDVADNRSSSLFYVLELIPRINGLKYILLENVKGFEKSKMRDVVLQCIVDANFHYRELILSPCQFGVPNTRHRYYLLAKKKDTPFCFDRLESNFNLPNELLARLTNTEHVLTAEKSYSENSRTGSKCYTLDRILEHVDETKYLIPRELLQKRAWVLDIRTGESSGSCCFTKAYGRYAEGTGSVFCPYSVETVKEMYKRANMFEKDSDEASNVLKEIKLRYFTPREVCRLMCFPEDFTFPAHTTTKQKYRLLGNSINVHLVSRLIFLLEAERRIL